MRDVDLLNSYPELEGLTPTELQIWRVLWEAQGEPVSIIDVGERLFGAGYRPGTIKTYMTTLRKKLRGLDWRIDTHRRQYSLKNSTTDPRAQVSWSLHPAVAELDDDPSFVDE